MLSHLWSEREFTKKYGQWAIITGSTDGIGLGFAKDLASRGHSIVIVGRNDKKLTNTKLELEQVPNVGQVITVKIDMSDASIENYQRARKIIDPDNRDIGILINNAGLAPEITCRFHNHNEQYDRDIVNVNILGVVEFTRMILPGMIKRERGLIMNVSSTLGCTPMPYMHLYGATKAFINGFSSIIQSEYSSYPVDIVNLTPGPVATKMFNAINDSAFIRNSNPFCPTSEAFARAALTAVSTGLKNFSGYFGHELVKFGMETLSKLYLLDPIFYIELKLFAKDYRITPKFIRKKCDA